MGAQFKKRIEPTRMVYPNSIYPDLYDNKKNDTDIAIGTVGSVTKNSFIIGDFVVPEKPLYGDGKLIGSKVGLYINTITAGNHAPGIPGIKAYKVPVNIGAREGGKSSAGTLIATEGFAQISAYHTNEPTMIETFDGYQQPQEELVELVQDVIVKKSDPYLSKSDGYKYGKRFGDMRMIRKGIGQSKHHKRYGQKDGDDEEIYKVKYQGEGTTNWFSVKENKHWARYNKEKWDDWDIGGGGRLNSTGYPIEKHGILKYSKTETISRTNTEDDVQRANSENTFFDGVTEAQSFITQDKDGTITKAAFGNVAFSSSKVKSGGQALHMHTVYPHRDNVNANIFYPSGENVDYNENNQTIFVTKELPLPTHLYSHRSRGSGNGHTEKEIKPMMPSVNIVMNIEALAPMLEVDVFLHDVTNDEEALTGNNPDMHRLSRSLVVTFGEDKPTSKDTLYSYVKKHAPNATGAGGGPTGAGNPTGDGSSAKSFMGLAIVNDNGIVTTTQLGRYYHSAPGSQGSSPKYGYHDTTFRLDPARGEIACGTTPLTNNNKSILGLWANLEFQLHPDFSGAYYSISDPDNGDIIGTLNPYSSGILRNIKNVTASSTGLWAMNDTTNFPRYMTVWVNNFQAIKGAWDKTKKRYKTGLAVAEDMGNDAMIKVYSKREHDSTALIQGSASSQGASFITTKTGYKLSCRGTVGDSTTDRTAVVTEQNLSDSNGYPRIPTNATNGYLADEDIYFAADCDPDKQVTETVTMENSIYIDKISLSNFGMGHSNATPNSVNSTARRIKIPKTYKSSPPGYKFTSSGNLANITDDLADHSSYICFGFDDIADFEGSNKLILMNGFSTDAANTEIFLGDETNVNSDYNCLRAGYTSIEDYGRQGSQDSYSRSIDNVNPSQIANDSPTFSNGAGIPLAKTDRGLLIGDLGFTKITCISSTQADYGSNAEGEDHKYLLLYANTGTSGAEQSYLIWFDHNNNAGKPVGLSETYNVEIDISGSIGNTAIATALRNGISGNSDFAAAFTVGGTATEVTLTDKLGNTSKNPVVGAGFLGTVINLSANELSVNDSDDGTVSGFTHKGLMRMNFNRRITRMTGVTLSNQSSAGAGTIKVNTLTAGTVTLQVNDYIQVNSVSGSDDENRDHEQMRIKSIVDASANPIVLNVEKGLNGVSVTHAQGSTVDLVAMPEKRECIFTSARITKVLDLTRVTVDSPSVFNFESDQDYILYIYDDSHATPTTGFPKTLKVIRKSGNEIEFNQEHGLEKNNKFKYLISPKKYWLMFEIHNWADSGLVDTATYTKTDTTKALDSGPLNATSTTINLVDGDAAAFEVNDVIIIDDEHIQITAIDASGDPDVLTVQRSMFGTTAVSHNKFTPIYFAPRRYLPEKNFESAVIMSEIGEYGATFNETLYNDGDNINNWDLDPFVKADDTAIDLKDYGFGDFKEEGQEGGHLGHRNLNIKNDITQYKEIDISGVVTVDNVEANDTFTVLLSPDEPDDNFRINVDTETGTNVPYAHFIYEDELPVITNFNLAPNKEDPFNIDYTWACDTPDIWYGFLHVSSEGISDQYHGAVIHLPLDDKENAVTGVAAIHGDKVSSTANSVYAYDGNGDSILATFGTSVGTATNAQPTYHVEGLAGNCLSFDSNDLLKLGADGNNCLGTTVTKEMSVNVHVTHDDGNFSANSGIDQFILYKGLALENQAFSIHGERVGTTTSGRIVARVFSDGGSTGKFVQLTSSTIIKKNVPLNIILTFDANLVTGNVKLFINGKLEDQSGPVLTSHSASATGNTGWIHKTNVCSENSPLNIGAKADAVSTTSALGWKGKIEEIVVYDKVLYPVDVKSGKFTFTKPLMDLMETTTGNSQSYDAKLFVKDYHNIRGRKVSDVATTPSISHRKAAFRLNGVKD